MRRAQLGHKRLVIPRPDGLARHQPDIHRRYRSIIDGKAQPLVFIGRLHRHKRDFAEHKGVIAEAKQAIDAINHPRRGAPVGIERIVGGDVPTRFHVGKDIRAAEGVNGLLGITNQQQRGVCLTPPDAAKDSVLLGVGILKFVDHRYRKALANRAGQRFAALPAQGVIQAAKHIVKAQLAAAAFLPRDRFADFNHCPGNHQIGQG